MLHKQLTTLVAKRKKEYLVPCLIPPENKNKISDLIIKLITSSLRFIAFNYGNIFVDFFSPYSQGFCFSQFLLISCENKNR